MTKWCSLLVDPALRQHRTAWLETLLSVDNFHGFGQGSVTLQSESAKMHPFCAKHIVTAVFKWNI